MSQANDLRDYYFSLDNLVKDMFLRKHMDSQGFVFLSVILNFNRIKQLSSDAELIRSVCWRSPEIEFQTGGDGLDRIRKSHDWKQWVLWPMDVRDATAQNDGPTQLFQPQLPAFGPGFTPSEMPRASMVNGNSPGPFVASQYPEAQMNGHSMPNHISDSHITQTPLSAAVPDFTPSLQPEAIQSSEVLDNPSEETFSDEQIEALAILVRKQRSGAPSVKSPSPSASRTFSNGSIDPLAISDELSTLGLVDRLPSATTNGDHTPER
ncbi:MAG: La RNA-binding domain-containing protein [Janthinobacterium lividum]